MELSGSTLMMKMTTDGLCDSLVCVWTLVLYQPPSATEQPDSCNGRVFLWLVEFVQFLCELETLAVNNAVCSNQSSNWNSCDAKQDCIHFAMVFDCIDCCIILNEKYLSIYILFIVLYFNCLSLLIILNNI